MFRPLAVGHIQGARKFFDIRILAVYLFLKKNNMQQVGVKFHVRNIVARIMYNI